MPELKLTAAAAYDLLPEPVACCRKGKIFYRNPAFAAAFPALGEGKLLPAEWRGEEPPCTGVTPGWRLLCWSWGESVIVRLTPLERTAVLPEHCMSLLSQRVRQPLTVLTFAQERVERQCGLFLQQGCEEPFSVMNRARLQLLRLCRELELTDGAEEPFDFSPTLVDLDGLCRDTVRELEAPLEQVGATVTYTGCDENLYADCDDLLVQTLICHLVSNAVQHADGPAHMELHLDKRRDMALVTLLDDGPGMDTAALSGAFTAPPGAVPMDTLGLGLMACRRIALLHQGSLMLSNRPGGRGLKATFSLPLCPMGSTQALRSDPRFVDNSGGVPLVLRELSGILPERCYAKLSDVAPPAKKE